MALAATVIPLSIVFIMKTMCDWRRNSFWYSNAYDCNYEDTLYIQPSPLHQSSSLRTGSVGGCRVATAALQQQANSLSGRLQTSASLQEHALHLHQGQAQTSYPHHSQTQTQPGSSQLHHPPGSLHHSLQAIQTITLNDEHTLKET